MGMGKRVCEMKGGVCEMKGGVCEIKGVRE